jgi:hypothetical protein|eukprot:COSAG01_NODE_31213_length_601_cov_1.990000_1_plen_104_part_00
MHALEVEDLRVEGGLCFEGRLGRRLDHGLGTADKDHGVGVDRHLTPRRHAQPPVRSCAPGTDAGMRVHVQLYGNPRPSEGGGEQLQGIYGCEWRSWDRKIVES